jgi:hypothetical protein
MIIAYAPHNRRINLLRKAYPDNLDRQIERKQDKIFGSGILVSVGRTRIHLNNSSWSDLVFFFAHPHNALTAQKVEEMRVLISMHPEFAARHNARQYRLYMRVQHRPAENAISDLWTHGPPFNRRNIKYVVHKSNISLDNTNVNRLMHQTFSYN